MSKNLDPKLRGFLTDLTSDDYHADKTFNSSSTLKLALKDPKSYYEQRVLGQPAPSNNADAFAIGNYVHTMFLEPEKLNDEYIVYHGTRRGKAWDSFEKYYTEKDKKIIITGSQKEMADKLFKAFTEAEIELGTNEIIKAPQLFTGGVAEESLFTELEGEEPEDKELIKVRFDYNAKDLLDLKTSGWQANTVEEARNIVNAWGYDTSAALYADAYEKETGIKKGFVLVFISKDDFKVNIYRLSKETLEIGRAKYKKAISLICGWKRTGIYYSSKIREI